MTALVVLREDETFSSNEPQAPDRYWENWPRDTVDMDRVFVDRYHFKKVQFTVLTGNNIS